MLSGEYGPVEACSAVRRCGVGPWARVWGGRVWGSRAGCEPWKASRLGRGCVQGKQTCVFGETEMASCACIHASRTAERWGHSACWWPGRLGQGRSRRRLQHQSARANDPTCRNVAGRTACRLPPGPPAHTHTHTRTHVHRPVMLPSLLYALLTRTRHQAAQAQAAVRPGAASWPGGGGAAAGGRASSVLEPCRAHAVLGHTARWAPGRGCGCAEGWQGRGRVR